MSQEAFYESGRNSSIKEQSAIGTDFGSHCHSWILLLSTSARTILMHSGRIWACKASASSAHQSFKYTRKEVSYKLLKWRWLQTLLWHISISIYVLLHI